MALPDDLTTFTLHLGQPPYTNAKGDVVPNMTGKLRPIHPTTFKPLRLVHVEDGGAILPLPVTVTITNGTGSVGPLPHTDNPSLSMVGFLYEVTWDVASNKPSPGNKRFAAPSTAGSAVDFDLLEASEAIEGVVVPVLVSAQSLIGLDTDGVPFYDPDGVGTPTGIALDTDGVPYLTLVA